MASVVSTITSKWQVTIPEDIRKEIPFKVGQRIAWQVEGDRLVGQRVRSIGELAGCLKAQAAGDRDAGRALARAAVARHQRLSRQKP